MFRNCERKRCNVVIPFPPSYRSPTSILHFLPQLEDKFRSADSVVFKFEDALVVTSLIAQGRITSVTVVRLRPDDHLVGVLHGVPLHRRRLG